MRGAFPATLIGSAMAHVVAGALILHRWAHPAPERVVEIDPAPAIAGDTFDLPQDDPSTTAAAAPGTNDTPSDEGTTAPKPRGASSSSSVSALDPSTPRPLEPSQYGAVGERGAFDLLPTFSRAFAQAASSDPGWATAPLGDAGAVEITFTIDEHGALVGTVVGGGGSAPLRRGVERTLALIAGRTFVAKGAETRFRVAAKIVPDEVHDGLHGEVFAIGASGTSAFFALAIGRRIDVDVR